MAVTIPKLGNVTINLAVAPFQIPHSLPGWGAPMFINGTGQLWPNSGCSSGGFWGLNYIYSDGQFTSNPQPLAPGNDPGFSWQVAGGAVNSFGIFDFYAGPPTNVTGTKLARYGPAVTDWTRMAIAQGDGEMFMYCPNGNGKVYPGTYGMARLPMPNILEADTIVQYPTANIDPQFQYYSNPFQGGDIFIDTPIVYRDPNTGIPNLAPPCTQQFVNLANGNTAWEQVLIKPQAGGLPGDVTAEAFNVNVPCPPGIFPAPVRPVPPTPIQVPMGMSGMKALGLLNSAFSPSYAMYIGRVATFGLFLHPLLAPTYLRNPTADQPNYYNLITLEDPADSAALAVTQGSYTGGQITTTPGGDFLCATPDSTAPVHYLIQGNGNGYYKIDYTGIGQQSPGWNPASGGFGMDLSGNFWAFVGGQLVSSLGFPPFPVFPRFPQVQAGWVDCRNMPCAYPWYG